MAEETNATTTTQANTTTQTEPTTKPAQEPEVKEPSVNELMTQIAQLKADNAKQKNALDKALKEKGDVTKQLRARQTADELEEEAKREEREEHEKYVKNLEREVALSKSISRYLGMGMDSDLATKTANAELDGDMDTVIDNCNKNKQAAIKAAEAEWLKNRPQVNVGTGEHTVTKEEFDKMGIAELTKFKRANPNEYRRLMGKE